MDYPISNNDVQFINSDVIIDLTVAMNVDVIDGPIEIVSAPIDTSCFSEVSELTDSIISEANTNRQCLNDVLKKDHKRHHVQRCSGINCGNNRFDNPDISNKRRNRKHLKLKHQ